MPGEGNSWSSRSVVTGYTSSCLRSTLNLVTVDKSISAALVHFVGIRSKT